MGRVVRFWMLRIEHSHAPVLPPLLSLSFTSTLSPKTLFALWRRQFKENRNANSRLPPPLSSQTRHLPRRSASRCPKRRPRVSPRADTNLRRDDRVVVAAAVAAVMVMMMTMEMGAVAVVVVRLAQGHRDSVCACTSFQDETCEKLDLSGRTDAFSNVFMAFCLLAQAEIPGRIAMRLPKSGGTDRARSPFARFGSTRRARTCSCAGSLLHASYVRVAFSSRRLILPVC